MAGLRLFVPPSLAEQPLPPEVPDCDCPVRKSCSCEHDCDCPPPLLSFSPCPHVLAADHDVPLEEWTELLWAQFPKDYVEPPLPPKRTRVQCRNKRVDKYARRYQSGYAIYHPGDLYQRPEKTDDIARPAGRLINGAVDEDEELIADRYREDAPKPEEPWVYPGRKSA